MASLSSFVVLDLSSGTYFPAVDACLIDWASLSPDQQQAFEDGTDTDRFLIASEKGQAFL